MYPDCVRKKNVIGKVIDIAEGKVWWLLSTGMTATTTNPHKKYKAGNFYKVEYGGLSADKLKNTIKVLSHIPFPWNITLFLENCLRSVGSIEMGYLEVVYIKAAGTSMWFPILV